MPTKKQLDNLKNGKATRFRSGEEAARTWSVRTGEEQARISD